MSTLITIRRDEQIHGLTQPRSSDQEILGRCRDILSELNSPSISSERTGELLSLLSNQTGQLKGADELYKAAVQSALIFIDYSFDPKLSFLIYLPHRLRWIETELGLLDEDVEDRRQLVIDAQKYRYAFELDAYGSPRVNGEDDRYRVERQRSGNYRSVIYLVGAILDCMYDALQTQIQGLPEHCTVGELSGLSRTLTRFGDELISATFGRIPSLSPKGLSSQDSIKEQFGGIFDEIEKARERLRSTSSGQLQPQEILAGLRADCERAYEDLRLRFIRPYHPGIRNPLIHQIESPLLPPITPEYTDLMRDFRITEYSRSFCGIDPSEATYLELEALAKQHGFEGDFSANFLKEEYARPGGKLLQIRYKGEIAGFTILHTDRSAFASNVSARLNALKDAHELLPEVHGSGQLVMTNRKMHSEMRRLNVDLLGWLIEVSVDASVATGTGVDRLLIHAWDQDGNGAARERLYTEKGFRPVRTPIFDVRRDPVTGEEELVPEIILSIHFGEYRSNLDGLV